MCVSVCPPPPVLLQLMRLLAEELWERCSSGKNICCANSPRLDLDFFLLLLLCQFTFPLQLAALPPSGRLQLLSPPQSVSNVCDGAEGVSRLICLRAKRTTRTEPEHELTGEVFGPEVSLMLREKNMFSSVERSGALAAALPSVRPTTVINLKDVTWKIEFCGQNPCLSWRGGH